MRDPQFCRLHGGDAGGHACFDGDVICSYGRPDGGDAGRYPRSARYPIRGHSYFNNAHGAG